MPPKTKGSSKPEPEEQQQQTPTTVGERFLFHYHHTNPVEKRRQEVGIPGLTPAEKKTYTNAKLILPVANRRVPLSNKAEREYWKSITKEGLPIRRLPKSHAWGKEKNGQDIATLKLQEFNERTLKHARLTALDILHRQFLAKRDLNRRNGSELATEEIEEEKKRRTIMANLKRDLYGEIIGSLAKDPEWDDVIPIPQDEPEGALARIAYPDNYAEAVSYLRAVMAAEELSPRCLRLAEHVISMNPGHYTVWLYRFKIIAALQIPIPDEIKWLNEIALANLKNYQIWNHRQLLMDHHYPTIRDDAEALKQLARSERDFITVMLDEDTKNYHVWSYRQYLVGKLGMWSTQEFASTQNHIEDDLRNNSAWSHRFFLVTSNPEKSTPGSTPNEVDPQIPSEMIDHEINYAKEKIGLAPQNQSAWNYLRGMLTKGGRPLSDIQQFAEGLVVGLGTDEEDVKSSHALDLLSAIYEEAGDLEKAKLCLKRLSEKWDPVREGYWKYRESMMTSGA